MSLLFAFSLPRSVCCGVVIAAYKTFASALVSPFFIACFFFFVVTLSAVHFTVCSKNADNTTLFHALLYIYIYIYIHRSCAILLSVCCYTTKSSELFFFSSPF